MKKHKSEEGNKSQIAILYIVVKGGKMIKDGIAWRAKPSTDTDKEPSRPRKSMSKGLIWGYALVFNENQVCLK